MIDIFLKGAKMGIIRSVIQGIVRLMVGLYLLSAFGSLVELTRFMGKAAAESHKQGFYNVSAYTKKLTAKSP